MTWKRRAWCAAFRGTGQPSQTCSLAQTRAGLWWRWLMGTSACGTCLSHAPCRCLRRFPHACACMHPLCLSTHAIDQAAPVWARPGESVQLWLHHLALAVAHHQAHLHGAAAQLTTRCNLQQITFSRSLWELHKGRLCTAGESGSILCRWSPSLQDCVCARTKISCAPKSTAQVLVLTAQYMRTELLHASAPPALCSRAHHLPIAWLCGLPTA